MIFQRFIASMVLSLAFLLCLSGVAFGAPGLRIVDGDFGASTVSGNNYIVAQSEGGLVRSTDGALSFSVALLSPVVIHGIASEGTTVIGVGQNGQIFRSADSGVSFTAVVSAEDIIFGDLLAVVSSGGGRWVAVGSNDGDAAVFLSVDDGLNWTEIDDLPGDAIELRGVAWLEGTNQFLAVGETAFLKGVALVSAIGSNWAAAPLPEETDGLYFVAADSAGNALAGGRSGTLLQSGAASLDFSVLDSLDASESLTAGLAVDTNSWWVGGEEGLVLTLADGATTPSWVIEPDPRTNPVQSLSLVEDVVLVAGQFSSYPWEDLEIEFEPIGSGQYRLSLLNPRPFHQYRVERSPNLQTWNPVENSTQVAGVNPLEWTITPPATGVPRFYRVRLN